MAGLGRKIFTAGDVLTASDVQSYLQDQTVMNFAGTAARSSAIATPTQGMVSYRDDIDNLELYNGSEWVSASGLQLVKKQTIGSGVLSVTVTNAFSAKYRNYRIIVSGGSYATNATMLFELVGITTGCYSNLNYCALSGVTTAQAANSANASFFNWVGGAASSGIFVDIDLQNPFAVAPKFGGATFIEISTTGNAGRVQLYSPVTTSCTDFKLTPNTGSTMTGGTICVYGYGE
jgi:hypothetical protein